MEELRQKVTELFAANPSIGHSVNHALRVAYYAKTIARSEGYDEKEAELAGLLHDVGRTTQKEDKGHGPAGLPIARELLDQYTDVDEATKQRILKAIEIHSEKFTEGKLNNILQDADKLDGLGAVGVSRSYITQYSLPDYEPGNVYPKERVERADIHTTQDHLAFIMSWYDMLYTEKAKEIGKPRYEFMKTFMEQFEREVEEATE